VAAVGDGGLVFEGLYRELCPLVVRTVYLVIFDGDVAQEITHEAFLRLWQHQGRLGEHANTRAWLMKVAINLAIDHKRSLLTSVRQRLAPKASQDPAATALGHLHQDELRRALLTLPARDRALLVLRFEEDLSFPEIGRILGRPEPTVKTWLHRALARLQRRLGGAKADWLAEDT
jgi:RNA polymerase sigma-70 factor, ECF subfamily